MQLRCTSSRAGLALTALWLCLPATARAEADGDSTLVFFSAEQAVESPAEPAPTGAVIRLTGEPQAEPVAHTTPAASPLPAPEPAEAVAPLPPVAVAAPLPPEPTAPAEQREVVRPQRFANIRLAARRAAGLKAGEAPRFAIPLELPQVTAPVSAPPRAAKPAPAVVLPEVQRCEHSEPQVIYPLRQQPVAIRLQPETQAEPAEPIAESPFEHSLRELHRSAASASTIEEYTTIIAACREALQETQATEEQQFAAQFASWALNRRGQLHAEQGRGQQALADFETALGLDGSNWRARHNRGVSYAERGQFAEAFEDFGAVIATQPRFAKAYCNRATLYVQAGDFQKALDDYERAILLDGKLLAAHVGRGRLCHCEGRFAEALAHFTTVLNSGGDTAELRCSRADLLADMGRYPEALADYAKAIELDPGFGHAYRNGAWLLATCPDERYRDASNAIEGAIQALEMGYGQRHVALDTIAAALASGGHFEEAIESLDAALEEAPESSREQYLARRELYTHGQPFHTRPLDEVSQASYTQ